MLFQRLFIACWLLAGLAFMYIGSGYQAAFSYEPVGPRAYPLLMLGLMCAALLYLLLRPTPSKPEDEAEEALPLGKIVACFALLLAYALIFEPLGFIVSSTLAGLAFARLYGGRWLPSLLVSLLLAIGLYLLFDRALDVPLPLGLLSVLEV